VQVLACHNEMIYNPRVPRRFMLACLRPAAEGGESLIMRNTDQHRHVPPALVREVRERGGVLYVRSYACANNRDAAPSFLPTWQERCGCTNRASAERFWRKLGFTDIVWREDGGLDVRNVTSGFDANGVWSNIVISGMSLAADGAPFNKELLAEAYAESWRGCFGFRMQAGDVLVLDNLAVQHGRLPYVDTPDAPRSLLTVLFE